MKKIFLYLNEICLGHLLENGDKYSFYADSESVNEAMNKYPLQMKFFKLNKRGMVKYENIPFHFNEYLSALDREDLLIKANISDDDSLYEKLYKLSSLNVNPINFKISNK